MKKAYLTIDDSPSPDFRRKFEFLYDKRIPAVFFCQGERLLEYKTDMIDAIRKGFLIANHGYEHRYFSDLTVEECLDSIGKTDEIIGLLYKESGRCRPAKFFRFPYFDQGGNLNSNEYEARWSRPQSEWFEYPDADKRRRIQECLRKLGYRQPPFVAIADPVYLRMAAEGNDVRCTFDQMEYTLGSDGEPWTKEQEEAILARIDADLPEQGLGLNRSEFRDVILVHDHERTSELFFKIIDCYLEKPIQFLKAWQEWG